MATDPPNLHFTPPHHRKKTSKSSACSNFLPKSVIVALVLVIIPLFPSQAPDFLKQRILPQLWELLHLLFIGIAVCYGLLCKRGDTKDDLETYSIFDASHSYLSGISNMSSIFDLEYQNLYESRGKMGESIADRNQEINRLSHSYHKPLGLRVRSLKSSVAESRSNLQFPRLRRMELGEEVSKASEYEFGRHRSTSSQSSSSKAPSAGTRTPQSSPSHEQQQSQTQSLGEMDLLEFAQPTVISEHGDAAESSSGSCSEMNMQIEDDQFNEVRSASLGRESDPKHIRSWSFWRPAPSNVKVDDLEEEKDANSPSVNGEAMSITSDAGKDVREDSSLIDQRIHSLYSQEKQSIRPKGILMAKSVRTIRSRMVIPEVNSRILGNPLEVLSSKKSINEIQKSAKQNGRMEDCVSSDILEYRDDSVSVWNNSDMSSDEGKSSTYFEDDMELGSEVDRKADEFIAKFREQIRLQKIESFVESTT